jgi:TRAP-type C4-dicarboxylate transport system permease small subunit
MKRIGDLFQTAAEWAIGGALAIMSALVFANAAGRYLLNQGFASSEEIARLAFVWLVFLGAVVGVRERAHIGMDMLVRAMPRRAQAACLVVCNLLILYALWLFIDGSWRQTVIGMGSRTPVTGIPLASFAAAGLVAGIAMAVLFAVDLWRALSGRVADADLVQVRESADEAVHGQATDAEDLRK